MIKTDILVRLHRKTTIDPITNCWLYTGYVEEGYGRANFRGRSVRVHRISAHFHLGYDLTEKVLQVNHKCKNKHCWNPEHLYVGTQLENIHETRHGHKTECIRGHKFDEENTGIELNGEKYCKECRRERARLKYHGERY